MTNKLDLSTNNTLEADPETVPATAITAEGARQAHGDAATRSSEDGSHALTVLIVDDSKTIRRSASSLLEDEGWNVVTAEDGFDALSKVVAHQPDVIFADIMMPRLDGYQACALIKNNSRYRDIPVIMLSSKDSIFDKARGRIAGSEHYLTKPFTRRELVRAVVTATRKQRSPAQPA